ncbi:EAL domain-containing protein (putative c-di-GMP-specific phosphodiesterase class I) [Amorphus suaedae]
MGLEFRKTLTMAFQPTVDLANDSVFAHEALVRGPRGEAAPQLLLNLDSGDGYAFDQLCHLTAIRLADRLHFADTPANLSINFRPDLVRKPVASLARIFQAAEDAHLALERIVFECRDNESLDVPHTTEVLTAYREMGFKTGLDNFGPTHASLELLSKFQPDFVKIDMRLVHNIDRDDAKRRMVKNAIRWFRELNIRPICVGVETYAEFATLTDLGVDLLQGFLFARPAFERLATPRFPA